MRDICSYISRHIVPVNLSIETGTMYVCEKGDEVHTTTNNIVDYICAPHSGTLYSFDIDPSHISFSKKWGENAFHTKYFPGDSAEELQRLVAENPCITIDVLCLDSKDFDEDHMVKEFNAVKDNLAPDHYIMIDDIHNPNSVKYKKAVPLIKSLGYNTVEIATPTGMLLASRGYPLPDKL